MWTLWVTWHQTNTCLVILPTETVVRVVGGEGDEGMEYRPVNCQTLDSFHHRWQCHYHPLGLSGHQPSHSHLQRDVRQPVLHPQPFLISATVVLTWAMLSSLSQSTASVIWSVCFHPSPSKGGYMIWFAVACFQTDTTQHDLFQCLNNASSDGIISSSYLILLQILSLRKSNHAVWWAWAVLFSLSRELKTVIGVGYDGRNADFVWMYEVGMSTDCLLWKAMHICKKIVSYKHCWHSLRPDVKVAGLLGILLLAARCATEAFSTTWAVHIEDCEGWWLSGCHGSVVEHWRLKPEVSWVRLPAAAALFHFPLFSPHNI